LKNDPLIIEIQPSGAISFFDKQHNMAWDNIFVGWVELSDGHFNDKISLLNSKIVIRQEGEKLRVEFEGMKGAFLSDKKFN
jgi:hypothetical protein